jgi:tetratricopeptide (TPR) repeat protein
MRREFGWPLAELGNIRLRKGDLEGAEEAFLAAHQNAWTPQPGLVLARLGQGNVDAALNLICDAVEHPFDVPSKERPPFGRLRLAPLSEAQVEIAVAARNVAMARRAADELGEISAWFSSSGLSGSAALAQGRVVLLEGDYRRAVAECESAIIAWTDVGAPYEAAVARMVLADCRIKLGSADAAQMEWVAAHKAFERFGAKGWVEKVLRILDEGERAKGMSADPVVEANVSRTDVGNCVFRCEGDRRTVRFGGMTVLLHDLIGLRFLERMLCEPGREFHVLDLVAVERGSLPVVTRDSKLETTRADIGDAGCLLDDQARKAYKRHLVEVDEDIEEATAMNDPERLALAQADREYLINELSRAVGLGDRRRKAGVTSERARSSVTRSLRYGMSRIAEHHPSLAQHLDQTVRTGTYCVYSPDSRVPTEWVA